MLSASILLVVAALSGATHRWDARVVLESWPNSGETALELAVGVCKPAEQTRVCPIEVAVRRGQALLGSAKAFEFAAYGGEYSAEKVGKKWWLSSGSENNSQQLTASLVELAPTVLALFVHQESGWDHLYDAYVMFAAPGGALKKLWGHSSAMPREAGSTSAYMQDLTSDGFAELISVTSTYYSEVEEWNPEVYSWSSPRSRLKRITFGKQKVLVFAAIAGSFKTVAEAAELRKSNECLRSYHVLSSDKYGRLEPGWFVVAKMGFDKVAAADWIDTLGKTCGLKAYLRRAL